MSQTPYEAAVRALLARQPTRMVPGLDRITTLCQLLGRPDQAYPAIQISGTNGKTTVAHMVTSLLSALGLSAGTYTSPHLQDVRERIRVAGEAITREEMTAALDYLSPFLAEVDARHPQFVSFFETLTALAYTYFADRPVDVGVFEVGMGGQWDATNLVRGDVGVLTRVALDHPELGASVDQVASEKAGIIKDGAMIVSADQEPAAARVIADAAAAHGARLLVAGADFGVASRQLAVGGQVLTLQGVTGAFSDVYVPLHGEHQAANAACALVGVEAFLGLAGGLDPDLIREGFAAVRSPGRLEVVRRGDLAPVILDGAHNPAGARALAAALRDEFAYRHRVVVLGVLGDKDVEAIVRELAPISDHLVVTEPPSSRAAPTDRLEKAARATGCTVEAAATVPEALGLASGLATADDAVVVTGSLYTVGAARDELGLDSGAG